MKAAPPKRALLAVASLLSSCGLTAAQPSIAVCTEANQAACAASANRTCYDYGDRHECGYCLNGFFEYDGDCYAIEEIGTEGFLIMSKLLELYLPEYVDPEVSVAERALRLAAAAKIISFWDSQVPPPAFKLALNNETFLTDDERRGRLGISSALRYDPSSYLSIPGNRGELGRFEYAFAGAVDNGEDAAVAEAAEAEDGRKRRLASPGPERPMRRLEDVPPSVDWDEDGYCTGIKNQGLCGCCWAVSTAAAIESALMITGQTERDDRDKNSLSFQQMVSCDTDNLGCGGGNILMATRYTWEHNQFDNGNFGGLFSYEDYPYSDFLGDTTTQCEATTKKDLGTPPMAYLNYPKVVNSVNDRRVGFQERKERLMAAVAQQPVTAVLKSNCDVLMNYKEGVLTHDSGCECCDVECIDHAIVIVGYNANAEIPYWKLRNSWGEEWGEEGNFRIAMNDEGCGWGLFGMLAESALPSDAYQKLEDLPERPSWWETAQTWEKALVILFSILGFCCLCGCLVAMRNKCKKSE